MEIFNATHTISASSVQADVMDYSDLDLSRIVLKGNKLPLDGTFYFRQTINGFAPYALSICTCKEAADFKKASRGKLTFYIEAIDHSVIAYHFLSRPERTDRWDGSICGMVCVSKTQFKTYLRQNQLHDEDFTADNVLAHLQHTTAEAMTAYANGWLYSGMASDLEHDDSLSSYELFTEEDEALACAAQLCQDYFGQLPEYAAQLKSA